jgi:starch phosphorylase
MANLATVGSHAVNGVAALHTELLKKTVLGDFYEMWPEKFLNVTNGVTPRRWLALSNPELSLLITSKIGETCLTNEDELKKLEPLAEDTDFRARWREVKHARKRQLVALIHERTGVTVSADTMFDVQVKRIHEYKRQLLNLLHVISFYNRIKHDGHDPVTPRTVIFGGKAAPGYHMAKLIIKLINAVGAAIDADHTVRRPSARGLHSRLQREERPGDLPRRRAVRANLHGRQGSPWHWQHEVLHERRAHHRHARRRQRRDPRAGRR